MEEKVRHLLSQKDLKVTKVRLLVLNILLQNRAAMSHAEISKIIGEENIDKVTLYRTLNAFVEKGLAHKVATEDRNWLYAVYEENHETHTSEDHAHFVCDECEKIYCFPVDQTSFEITTQKKQGFKIRSREVRLHGLCPICN